MKYKGYELMKAVSEGKLNLKQKVSTTSLKYINCTIEFVLKDNAFNIMDLDFELIEDKIDSIEKIKTLKYDTFNKKQKSLYENMVTLANKLNEVIDKLNEMESKTND